MCPTVDCSNRVAQQAAVDGLAGCESDCSSTSCVDAYTRVVSFHDTCDEDDLIADIEHEIHEFEEVCEDATCNTSTEAFDANVCDEETTTPTKTESVSSASMYSVSVFAVVAAFVVAF